MLRSHTPTLQRICGIILIVASINFIAFMIITVKIGGDAISGRAEQGHYYVSEHGRQTEVSYPVYLFSYIHTISVMITHPLGLLAIFFLSRIKKQKNNALPLSQKAKQERPGRKQISQR